MKRIRLLFNGDVPNGITHWQMKVSEDGGLVGEKIILKDSGPVVIPLGQADRETARKLFASVVKLEFHEFDGSQTGRELCFEVEGESRISMMEDFWNNSEAAEVAALVSKLIGEPMN